MYQFSYGCRIIYLHLPLLRNRTHGDLCLCNPPQ